MTETDRTALPFGSAAGRAQVPAIDLVIVGGGPAGLTTALHVHAVAPHARIVVLEAETYPREKICAGGIGARGLTILGELGVELDCPMVNIDALAVRVGNETIVTRERDLGVVVRRIEFDHSLARAAIGRGIAVRDGCAVTAITIDDAGATVETALGDAYRARAIVGADGVAGIVRRACGFPRGALRAQVIELDTEMVAIDQPRDTLAFDFTLRDLRGYAWDFPTFVAGEAKMCRGTYALLDGGERGATPRAAIERYLAARGLDVASYRLKQFAERGFEPGAAISAPRVLLVGEAAGIDIATGEGIAQAIEYGKAAGGYLARALERDDFGFANWRDYIERRHVGWQLRIRHACYRAFYGAHRNAVERLMPRIGKLFRVGVQDFAGKPLSKLAIAHGAGQFLAALAREGMRA